ncbi:MAG: aspartate--tRNA ligase [Defluviitaleaceae bacterium]|nr:aspartate--tRNA ligase [Defluviitaleaceae bacterium]
MKRTHNNGELRLANVGEAVCLKGWVSKVRDAGIMFIVLRDRYGLIQLVVNPESADPTVVAAAKSLGNEYVIEVSGRVVERESKNPDMPTGDIEIDLVTLTVLATAQTTPLIIADETDALEETRLTYRYLDLRRPIMQQNIMLRHKMVASFRHYLDQHDFIDIETPYLTKATPEGARDYLVPSRVHPGEFYALPQSPQIFKQLLMVSGFERYYQVARCFRDEDLRADRQPEFTQLDIETSFLTQDDLMRMTEDMLKKMMHDVLGLNINDEFPVMTYEEAMSRFGSDKPDTRFEMELISLCDEVVESGFSVFSDTVKTGGMVKALNVKGAAEKFSRKNIDQLTDFVKRYKAKGLAWVKVEADGWTGPIAKFFNDGDRARINAATDAEAGDLLLFVADKKEVVENSLGMLRGYLGKELGLIDESTFNFLWVVDWPLFEYDEEAGRYFAAHHPFTMPRDADLATFDHQPKAALAQAYDIVLNGYEIGGGSIRIYDAEIQARMFKTLGFSEADQQAQFGFLIEALKYGTPPHGGIALGIDRLIMTLIGTDSIRDVVAFPKTNSAACLMTKAPSVADDAQLAALSVRVVQK